MEFRLDYQIKTLLKIRSMRFFGTSLCWWFYEVDKNIIYLYLVSNYSLKVVVENDELQKQITTGKY